MSECDRKYLAEFSFVFRMIFKFSLRCPDSVVVFFLVFILQGSLTDDCLAPTLNKNDGDNAKQPKPAARVEFHDVPGYYAFLNFPTRGLKPLEAASFRWLC